MKNKNIELTKEDLDDLIRYMYELCKFESYEVSPIKIRELLVQIVFRQTDFYSTEILEEALEYIKTKRNERIIQSIIE